MRLQVRKVRIKGIIHKGRPFKALCFGQKRSGGRNNTGRITAPHRGGGAKRLIRIIDWKRNDLHGVEGEVMRVEYDPGRTARIALVKYDAAPAGRVTASGEQCSGCLAGHVGCIHTAGQRSRPGTGRAYPGRDGHAGNARSLQRKPAGR